MCIPQKIDLLFLEDGLCFVRSIILIYYISFNLHSVWMLDKSDIPNVYKLSILDNVSFRLFDDFPLIANISTHQTSYYLYIENMSAI